MRIIGHIEHPRLKITVFQMDGRISLKVEDGMHEQTYKFRDGEGVNNLEEARHFADAGFLRTADAVFRAMREARLESLSRGRGESEDEFDSII